MTFLADAVIFRNNNNTKDSLQNGEIFKICTFLKASGSISGDFEALKNLKQYEVTLKILHIPRFHFIKRVKCVKNGGCNPIGIHFQNSSNKCREQSNTKVTL
jgi:hypothetical protein